MKYQVLETFKVKTSQGEMELQPGQVITLPQDKAIKLLNESKVKPIEKVAYKVYSKILDCYLWVVETEQDLHALRSHGIEEAIYTGNEIRELKKLSREDLKALHEVKETFKHSKIEAISRRKKESHNERD